MDKIGDKTSIFVVTTSITKNEWPKALISRTVITEFSNLEMPNSDQDVTFPGGGGGGTCRKIG